jgi:hypothetical protein
MNQALIRGFQVQGGTEEAANSKPSQWLKGVMVGWQGLEWLIRQEAGAQGVLVWIMAVNNIVIDLNDQKS